jgi:hypothetical protein
MHGEGVNLRLSNVLLAAAGASAVATAAVATTARVDFGYERPALHVALETAAALIALVAAYLVLGRFRRRARLDDLLLFVALGTLAVSNLFFAALPAASTTEPSRFSTWAALGGQLLGALGLAAAAFAPADRIQRP